MQSADDETPGPESEGVGPEDGLTAEELEDPRLRALRSIGVHGTTAQVLPQPAPFLSTPPPPFLAQSATLPFNPVPFVATAPAGAQPGVWPGTPAGEAVGREDAVGRPEGAGRAGWSIWPEPRLGPLSTLTAGQVPGPAGAPPRLPGGYLPPSGTYVSADAGPTPARPNGRTTGPSLSLGATPVAPAIPVPPAVPAPPAVPVAPAIPVPAVVPAAAAPAPQPAPLPTPAIAAPETIADASDPVAPAASAALMRVATVAPGPIDPPSASGVNAAPARADSRLELLSFSLVAAGTMLGLASFFFPWASAIGIGVGTLGSHPTDTSAWAMPATPALLLVTLAVLALSAAWDYLERRFPVLSARPLEQLVGVAVPILLAGLYAGVALLYLTFPYGFGSGIVVLLLAAGIELGGGLVGLLFPSRAGSQ